MSQQKDEHCEAFQKAIADCFQNAREERGTLSVKETIDALVREDIVGLLKVPFFSDACN